MLPLNSFCFYCLLAFLARLWLLNDKNRVQGMPLGSAAGVGSEHICLAVRMALLAAPSPSLLLPQPLTGLKHDLVPRGALLHWGCTLQQKLHKSRGRGKGAGAGQEESSTSPRTLLESRRTDQWSELCLHSAFCSEQVMLSSA